MSPEHRVPAAHPEVTLAVDRAGTGERPEVLWLDNGVLRLGLVPAAGGRLLSVQLDGRETLWRNDTLLDDALHPRPGVVIAPHDGPMSAWLNLGGDKTWPAPQGWSGPTEWAGPPDPVLDSGVYRWDARSDAEQGVTVTMTSDDDPRTGLRLERELTLAPGEAAYRLRLRATNTGAAPVTWALWNVTQRAADAPGAGGTWVGVEDGQPRPVALAVGTGAPEHRVEAPGVVGLPHQDVVGKLGFPTATGWVAHAAGGTTTTQVVEVDRHATYPDGGSRVEIWMEHPLEEPIAHLGDLRPTARIVEVEVLGPLTRLAPGASTELVLRSGTTAGEDPVRVVAAAGHWSVGASGAPAFHAYVDGLLVGPDGETVLAEVRAGTATPVAPSPTPPGGDGHRAYTVLRGGGTALPAGAPPQDPTARPSEEKP